MPQALMVAAAKTLMAVGVKAGIAKAVASFVVTQTAISVAAHAASRVLGRRSGGSATLQERQASVINVQIGEVPREAVFGTTTTGGSLVDAFSYGGQYGTDTFAQCIALADHEISRIVGFYVDDQYVAWAANGVQAGFNGKLSLLFQNASEAGHAPPSVALANGWSSADVGRGVARVWVFATFDEQVWSQGFPRFRWVLEGGKVYDPRRDAALGYTGEDPCDFDDPTTWVASQNPILLDYAYRRGIYVAGRHQEAGQLLIGRGLSALEAPPEAIIAAANVCDEDLGSGALRYRAAGVIRADQPFIEAAEMFAAACAGVIVQREGGVEIEPGQAKAAVVTITDGDLVVGETISFSTFLPDTEGGRVNTVVPRYISPEQGWKDHAGPVRRVQDDIVADGGPREATLALALVTDAAQADRSAEIARRLYRLERRATIVLPPKFAHLEEGDWIAWTSARFHGGATVRYRIESWSRGEDWRMRLTLREIAASVYGEADPIADQADPAPAPVPADALSLTDVTVEAITLAGETSTLPAVRFGWDTPVDPAIIAIRAEIRQTGETEISTSRTEAVGDGVLVVTNGVAPGQSLQGRLVPIGHPSRPVTPSSWVTISTAEIGAAVDPAQLDPLIEAGEATAVQLGLELLDRFNHVRDVEKAADAAIFVVTDRIETVETDVSASVERLDAIEVELGEGAGSLGARVVTLETATADLEAGKASATSVTLLSARVGDVEGTITDFGSVLVDQDERLQLVRGWKLDAAGKVTGILNVNDGTSTAIQMLADFFSLEAEGGNGIEIDGVNGILRILGTNRRIVLKPSGVVFWVGPSSVTPGTETIDNGILGISETDGFFGGATLTGPFDTGVQSGSVSLTGTYQDIAVISSKRVRDGYYLFWPQFTHQGTSDVDGEGEGAYEVDYRIVSTNASGGDVEVIDSGLTGQSGPGGSFGPTVFEVLQPPDFATRSGARTGARRLVMQARLSAGTSATVSNRRLRGFYAT